MNRAIVWSFLVAGLTVVGCRKEPSVPASMVSTNAPAAGDPIPAGLATPSPRGPGPLPQAPAPAVIQAQADPSATLSQLSAELQKYVVRTRSVPKNFEEFITRSQVQAPEPPEGKKYAIQNKAVVLVKR